MMSTTTIKNKYTGIILMIGSALCTSFGQLLWKLSCTQMNMQLVLGFVLYAIGAIFMITAFNFGSLSKLHPLICTSYIFAIALGYFILGEHITFWKIAGIIIIISGVVLIAGDNDD